MLKNKNSGSSAEKRRGLTRRLTLSAIFLALAIIVKVFATFMVPLFGANGMKIEFWGIFTTFPAILFGPLYGAVVAGLCDLLGYLVKPDGVYIPWLTLTAALGGAIKGWLWLWVKNCNAVKVKRVLAVIFALVLSFGVLNHVLIASDGVSREFIASADSVPTETQMEHLSEKGELGFSSAIAHSFAEYYSDSLTVGESSFTVCKVVKADEGTFYLLKSAGAQGGEELLCLPLGEESGASQPSDAVKAEVQSFVSSVFGAETTVSYLKPWAENEAEKLSLSYRSNLALGVICLTVGLEFVGLMGLAVLGVLALIAYKKKTEGAVRSTSDFAKILAVLLLAGVIITTINTKVLMEVLVGANGNLIWKDRIFFPLWLVRVFEEVVATSIQAYIVSALYGVLKKQLKR